MLELLVHWIAKLPGVRWQALVRYSNVTQKGARHRFGLSGVALDLRPKWTVEMLKPKRRRGLAPLPPHSKGERDTALD
jgi:hypothetical protein